MTYFGFLLLFIGLPLVLLLILNRFDERRRKSAPEFCPARAIWLAIGLHVLLAVLYTTPWDNYLVATGVWYYDPKLISGVLLGWVPLEEYTFFVLETLLTGFWWWFLARRLPTRGKFRPRTGLRIGSTAVLGVVWFASLSLLLSGWDPGTYLGLILAWALPPIMLQLAFGADLLWHHRRLVLLAILPLYLYLSATDSLAITSGTWTIDPGQSTGMLIGSLPVEEAIFFLVTVVLIGFGLTLSLARLSERRWPVQFRASLREPLLTNTPWQVKSDGPQ